MVEVWLILVPPMGRFQHKYGTLDDATRGDGGVRLEGINGICYARTTSLTRPSPLRVLMWTKSPVSLVVSASAAVAVRAANHQVPRARYSCWQSDSQP